MFTVIRGKVLQYAATFTISLQVMSLATAVMWTSPTLPELLSSESPIGVQISVTEMSIVASVLVFGSIFGALSLQKCFDKFGVRKTLLVSAVPVAIGWVLVGLANSVWMLILGRFIIGFATIFAPAGCSIYIAEVAEPQIRGKLCILNALMLEAGNVLTIVVGAYTSYQILALVSFLLPIIFVSLFYFMPETPCYYLKRGETEKALEILQEFRGKDDVTEEFKRMKNNVVESLENKSSFIELFKNNMYRKYLFIVIGTKTVHQVSGTNVIQQYMQFIFEKANSGLDSVQSTIISVFVPLPATLLASLVIDKFGRRPLYFCSVAGCMIALLLEFAYFTVQKHGGDTQSLGWMPLTGIFLFFTMRSQGLTQFPYLLLSELFPPNIKHHAASVILLYNAILFFIATFLFPLITEYAGADIAFLIFAVCLALGLIFAAIFIPETKGKTLEQIQTETTETNK